jgi:HAE1 family hydrophobic/amphiphilic exporter-1
MMTTMAALLGTLPIALGIGAGADARRPLGLAVVGGCCLAAADALHHPVLYLYMSRRSAIWRRGRSHGSSSGAGRPTLRLPPPRAPPSERPAQLTSLAVRRR